MGTAREYEKTHPWITFVADLTRAPERLWLLLGEASAQCESIARAPVRPHVSTEMHRVFFAKGVHGTTAIEGNTLSEEEVLKQLEGVLQVPPSKEYLAQETKNVIDACNEMLGQILRNEVPSMSADLMAHYNRKVLRGLEDQLEDGVVPGEIPTSNVGVPSRFGSYLGAPRQDCGYLMDRLASWINDMDAGLWPDWAHETRIPMAILKAVLAHLYIAWIHPFGDGNGRTARLVEFLLLVDAGVPSPAAHLLSNHYNETRTRYYRELARASQSGGEIFPFIVYAVEGLVDGLRKQLDHVAREHLNAAWHSYVLALFREFPRSEASLRQRELVLELSTRGSTPRALLTGLTPKLAQMYADKTSKTLSRDLNRLRKMSLVRRTRDGYMAATNMMLGFMPIRNHPARAVIEDE